MTTRITTQNHVAHHFQMAKLSYNRARKAEQSINGLRPDEAMAYWKKGADLSQKILNSNVDLTENVRTMTAIIHTVCNAKISPPEEKSQ